VLCAKEFVGNEPFAVLYGDDLIEADYPTTKSLIEIYERFGLGTAGVKAVSPEQITKYCSLKLDEVEKDIFRCTDMIEKPSPDKIMSLYSILGRVVLPPEIFSIIENLAPGAGGEIQLTDAMCQLSRTKGMMAYAYPGTHHDMGSKLGLLKAGICFGIKHEEIGEDLKIWLKEFVKGL
jgi:UTP--glucose-1-phosphate uridylyltransferase